MVLGQQRNVSNWRMQSCLLPGSHFPFSLVLMGEKKSKLGKSHMHTYTCKFSILFSVFQALINLPLKKSS